MLLTVSLITTKRTQTEQGERRYVRCHVTTILDNENRRTKTKFK